MADDVGGKKTLERVELEHAGHKIHEILAVKALRTLRMNPPKKVGVVFHNELVVFVFHMCFVERRIARIEDEENYPKGKKVHSLTLVWLF